jgi:glycosyltransferase involved in cell wall biosynthesis
MSGAPRVSVVMPAYNAGRYIREAVASVLGQTEGDLELVVVDDGSTDDTAAIAATLGAADPRVRLVQQPNSGKPAIARNRGIRESRGEIVCFLDADDVWRPEKLAACLAVLDRRPDVQLVFHDVEYMTQDGAYQGRSCLGSLDFGDQVLARSQKLEDQGYLCDPRALFFYICTRVTTIYMSAATIRRSRLFQEPVFFAEDVVAGEDADLWFRIVKTGGVAYVGRALSGYRIHGQSVTHRPDRDPTEPLIVHVRNYGRFKGFLTKDQRRAYRRRIATALFDAGYHLRRGARRASAAACYLRSFAWRPGWKALKGLATAGLPARKPDGGSRS